MECEGGLESPKRRQEQGQSRPEGQRAGGGAAGLSPRQLLAAGGAEHTLGGRRGQGLPTQLQKYCDAEGWRLKRQGRRPESAGAVPTQIKGTSGGRSFARGQKRNLSGWEGRLQVEPPSPGPGRETPSSCADTDPEGRLQTPRSRCVQSRGGQAVPVGAAGRVPLQGSAGSQAQRQESADVESGASPGT